MWEIILPVLLYFGVPIAALIFFLSLFVLEDLITWSYDKIKGNPQRVFWR